VNHYNFTLTII